MSRTPLAAVLALGVAAGALVAAQAPQTLTVTSPALRAGEMIPAEYTADGRNISPPLQWSGAPPGTKEFAVVCFDPDVPVPQGFVHWVLYKIPGAATGVPEDVPFDDSRPMPSAIAGAVQGTSGFRRPIYRGPAPPPGKPHHYHFAVYALDAVLDLRPGLTRAELMEAIDGHVVAQGELVALYERKPGQ
ncbi:MAG: YbhB/YbcL family Raf kinase inhibitor-like protein [Vicinamibacterales bacterium]